MDRIAFVSVLRELNINNRVLDWIEQTPGELEDLWAMCQRGDWMIWLLTTAGFDERVLRRITCDCAESALSTYERSYPDDPRPRNAIAVARRYADGEATRVELIAARGAARAAAKAADLAATKAAAKVAANVAICNAAWAATYAAASNAAWAATYVVSWDKARNANIVRAHVPWADAELALEVFSETAR